MTSSLVGSEMCIRDRVLRFCPPRAVRVGAPEVPGNTCYAFLRPRGWQEPVSYTHLTLPTICSV
eukprot:298162-Prorocentrum_lima.AAC.1